MNDEGISVVIPVYNAEKTIKKCISSIRNQSYEKLQIICVDDGSLDNSLNLLLEIQKEDERIEVYSQHNSGPGAARNNGIIHSTKKYITFVDSDDEIEPNMYLKMITHLERNKLDCVVCDIAVINADKTVDCINIPIRDEIIIGKDCILEKVIKPLIEFNDKPNDGLPSMCNKLFVRSIIQEKDLLVNVNRKHGEDWEFCINYFRDVKSIGFIHEPLYRYIRLDNDSLLNAFQPHFLEMRLDSAKVFRKWFPELEWDSKEQDDRILLLPVKASEYYRINLRGIEAKTYLDKIYSICINSNTFYRCATRSNEWKALLDEKKAFDRFVWKSSTRAVCIYKIKRLVKKVIGK